MTDELRTELYSIERHGKWWSLYHGRTNEQHGANLCALSDFDMNGEATRELIVKALNTRHTPDVQAQAIMAEQLRTIQSLMQGVGEHAGKEGTTPVLTYIKRLEDVIEDDVENEEAARELARNVLGDRVNGDGHAAVGIVEIVEMLTAQLEDYKRLQVISTLVKSITRANSHYRYWKYRRSIGRPFPLWVACRQWLSRLMFELFGIGRGG